MNTSPKQQAEHQHNEALARCVAKCLLGRVVDDEWETLGEAERYGNFPEVVKAFIAGEDTEYFNTKFPELANSGILEDVVDAYIYRGLRRSIKPTIPMDKTEYSKSPLMEAVAQSHRDHPEALKEAFKQYMDLKGPPREPRIIVGEVKRATIESLRSDAQKQRDKGNRLPLYAEILDAKADLMERGIPVPQICGEMMELHKSLFEGDSRTRKERAPH